jgi:hypothetical protein
VGVRQGKKFAVLGENYMFLENENGLAGLQCAAGAGTKDARPSYAGHIAVGG